MARRAFEKRQALRSNLEVGSALIFPSRGHNQGSLDAVNFIKYRVKQNENNIIDTLIRKRLGTVIQNGILSEVFDGDPVLVPVPGHARRVDGGLWVAEKISEALVSVGLGQRVAPLLLREKAVPRSSGTSSGSMRPNPLRHYESLSLSGNPGYAPKIVLIDDVVTRGSTLIGCASRLEEFFPEVSLTSFALARVDNANDLAEVAQMLSPVIEDIRYNEPYDIVERRPKPA